jgi:hypothetical protein
MSNNKNSYKQMDWRKRKFSVKLISSSENGLIDKTLIESLHGKNQSK